MSRRFPLLGGLPLVWWVLAALLGVYGAGTLMDAPPLGDDGMLALYNGLQLAAAGLCWLRAWRGGGSRTERAAWVALGVGVAVSAGGDLFWSFALADDPEAPYPSFADALWIASYPAYYAGLGLLLRARLRGAVHSSLWLDGAIGACAVTAVAAALAVEPLRQALSGSVAEIATNLAYPVGDLLLLGLTILMVALTGWRPGSAFALLAAGFAAAAVGDGVYLVQTAHGTYVEGGPLDVLWPLSALLFAAAAWRPTGPRGVQLEGVRLVALPSVFAVVVLGILVIDQHLVSVGTLAADLALLTLALGVIRLRSAFGENARREALSRYEALTDALTGLGNRRALLRDLEAAFEWPGDGWQLALYDLDGFKGYNDTFGHSAGDSLIARFGAKLRAAVEPAGTAYRMGGDEFCVLAPVEAGDVAERGTLALRERGEGFSIGCSAGVVRLPEEAADPRSALVLVDARMYAQKGRRRSSAAVQTRDVLLSALHARRPAVVQHTEQVSKLARRVARELGIDSDGADVVARAADLCEIGKVAIPDSILEKEGALASEEMAFVRNHPLVGEAIVSAAPALGSVARLVRASHERWDGKGFPDGLAGEQIPLGARIVFVCDTYATMREREPVRTHEDALAELRAGAGTQFDPAVVEAFAAVRPPQDLGSSSRAQELMQ